MGGGQGAVAINDAITANATKLVKDEVNVVLLAGRGREVNMPKSVGKHVQVLEFTNRVTDYEQVADVVVTRAGATTMAELAAIGVATIIVPSPYLAGDHQTKNAKVYEKAGAAVVLNEFELKDNPQKTGKEPAHLCQARRPRWHGADDTGRLQRQIDMIRCWWMSVVIHIKSPRRTGDYG